MLIKHFEFGHKWDIVITSRFLFCLTNAYSSITSAPVTKLTFMNSKDYKND